jgi:hypothetical protein
MADVTISKVVSGAKNPAIIGGGFILGIIAQKAMNKIFNSESVVRGLGAETAQSLKDYAVPLATTALGVGVSIAAKDETIKKLAIGTAISGTVAVGTQFLWKKNFLNGLNGGVIGSLLGDDDDLDGYDDDLDGTDDDDLDGTDDDEDFGDIDVEDGVSGLGYPNIPISDGIAYSKYATPQEAESISGAETLDYSVL